MRWGVRGTFHCRGWASLCPLEARWCPYVSCTVCDGGKANWLKHSGSEG